MINFPCKCGHAFSLPDDQAGGLIQCPVCHLLSDVPTLNDLKHMKSDGTYEFGEHNSPTDQTTATDLHSVFTNKTTNSHGIEKDLRPKLEYFEAIGLQDQIKPKPAPRYDPVTGELIRPLQFKDEEPTPVLSIGVLVDKIEEDEEPQPLPVVAIPVPPVPKPQSLGYAIGKLSRQISVNNLGIELLMPANSIVMFFVFLLYILGYYITSGIATYVERFPVTTWPFLIVNLPMWLVISHIGCVIEDTGPSAIDELPRPLRNFSPGEDILTPLFRTLLAGVICFLPLVLGFWKLDPNNPVTKPILILLALGGAFFFPGVVLTSVAGTTVLNLRPDRVLAVIQMCGLNYLISVALFVLAIVPSIYYIAGELLFRLELTGPFFHKIDKPAVMFPLMMFTVYMLHFFAWHVGLMYRAHHEQFPWLAQRHIKKNNAAERQTLNG
jgi:hypothetical protein